MRNCPVCGRTDCVPLYSDKPIYFDRFLEVVHELGIFMKVVDGQAFIQALRRMVQEQGREYIFETFQNDMNDQDRLTDSMFAYFGSCFNLIAISILVGFLPQK